jgi:hypothetical protein
LEYTVWKNDKRMKGTVCEIALQKCVNLGYATFENKIWKHTDIGKKVVDNLFYKKDLIDALKHKKEFVKYDGNYTISDIPYVIWINKYPSVEKSFQKINDLFTTWWNKVYHEKTAELMFKNKHIKLHNIKKLYDFFKGEVPQTIKLYFASITLLKNVFTKNCFKTNFKNL